MPLKPYSDYAIDDWLTDLDEASRYGPGDGFELFPAHAAMMADCIRSELDNPSRLADRELGLRLRRCATEGLDVPRNLVDRYHHLSECEGRQVRARSALLQANLDLDEARAGVHDISKPVIRFPEVSVDEALTKEQARQLQARIGVRSMQFLYPARSRWWKRLWAWAKR